MQQISFDGQTVVVTGAGHGIGRAHALEFARRGAAVVVNDLARDAADEVVSLITEAGGTAAPSYDSVCTPEGGAAIVAVALDRFGSVDVLVHNAGILRPNYFEDLTVAEIDAVIDTHLRSSFFVTQPAWRDMQSARYGRIVMTGSGSGMFSHQGLANYAAAKAGVYGLTRALAFEGAAHGIKCNMIMPAAQTTITAGHAIPDMDDHWGKYASEADLAALREPSRRRTSLIAHLAIYLASRECPVSGEAFSAVSARYGRVFVGVADGWLAADPDADVTAEAIGDHFAQVRDISTHTVPTAIGDEYAGVGRRLVERAL